MIRSRFGNILVFCFGSLLIAVALLLVVGEVREFTARMAAQPFFWFESLVYVLPFGGLGLWCVLGSVENLRLAEGFTEANEHGWRRGLRFLAVVLAFGGLALMPTSVVLSARSGSSVPEYLLGIGFWAIVASLAVFRISEAHKDRAA